MFRIHTRDRIMLVILMMLLVIVFRSGIGFAQSDAEKSDTSDIAELDEVVVTGSRVERSAAIEPVSVYVVDIEELGPQIRSVGDALHWVPGVEISGAAPFAAEKRSTALIQGMPAQYSLVLVDGNRSKSDHIHTGVNLELLPISMIEKIEVIRGPGSVVHGSDALGGIVNIITKPIPEEPTTAFTINCGTEHTVETGLFHGMSIGDFGYTIMANHSGSDGLNATGKYDKNSGRVKLSYDPFDKLQLGLNGAYYKGNYYKENIENGIQRGEIKNSEDEMIQFGVEISIEPEMGAELKSTFGMTTYDRTFKMEEQKSYWRTTDNDVTEIVLQYNTPLGDEHYAIIGTECRREEFKRYATASEDMTIYSAYVQDEYSILDSLTLLLGLRMDDSDEIDTEFCPRSALHWSNYDADVRLAVAKGIRIPSLQDLYEEKYPHGDYYRDGNPDLVPEESVHYSLEAIYKPFEWGLEFSLLLFRNDLENMIVTRPTGEIYDGKEVVRRENIREAFTQGYEIGISRKPTEQNGFSFLLSYGYLDAEDETDNMQLAYNPKHTFKGIISYQYNRYTCGIQGQAVRDRKYRNKSNEIEDLDNYSLVDLSLGVDITKNVELSFAVRNLFDKEYENYEEGKSSVASGRFVMVRFRAEFL